MKKVTKSTYTLALADAISFLKQDKNIINHIRFIALLGSVKEKEHIPNYSDLDILLILKSDNSGAIAQNILLIIRNISYFLSKKYPIKISFLAHTEKEFVEYVEYEYLRHYSWGKVLYGEKKPFSKLFLKILSKKKLSSKELCRQMYNAIMHARFNLVRKYISFNKINIKNYQKELLKLFIDNLLEIADWRLIADGLWCISKKEIIKAIKRYSQSNYKSVVEKSYKYRKNWNLESFKKREIEKFFIDAIEFINDCVRDLEGKL